VSRDVGGHVTCLFYYPTVIGGQQTPSL